MSTKKGLCPVSFLWTGRGVGAWLMRISMITMFVMGTFHLFFITTKSWFWACLTLWTVGRVLVAVQKKRHT